MPETKPSEKDPSEMGRLHTTLFDSDGEDKDLTWEFIYHPEEHSERWRFLLWFSIDTQEKEPSGWAIIGQYTDCGAIDHNKLRELRDYLNSMSLGE